MLSERIVCQRISRLYCQRGKHWKNFYSIPYLRENGRNGFPRVHCLRFSSIFWTHLGGTCFSSWTAFLVFLTAASSTFDEGMPCETRDCHIKAPKSGIICYGSPSDSRLAYPFVLFLPLIRKTHKRLPMEERTLSRLRCSCV